MTSRDFARGVTYRVFARGATNRVFARGGTIRDLAATRPLLLAIACTLLAACADLPHQDTFYFDEDAMASLPEAPPLIESPPIEPVEAPLPVEPMPLPVGSTPGTPDSQSRPATAPPLSTSATAPVTQERIVVAAIPPSQPAVPALPPEDLEVLVLVTDLTRYNAFSADDIKREIATTTQALNRERNDANRVRLAILFTLTHSPQDDLRALQLLDNVARSGGSPNAIKQLAAVLQAQIAERARAVRDETARANEAAQKLEALRQMERSLLRDRVRSGGGGAGGGAGGGGH